MCVLPRNRSKITDETKYSSVKVPNSLLTQADTLIGKYGYKSRTEIVKEAVRDLLAKYHIELVQPQLPRFEQVNSDENGVKILDRELHEVVDVYFKPTGIRCRVHQSDDCEHVEFALKQPEVIRIIAQKRRKEGWKLPDV